MADSTDGIEKENMLDDETYSKIGMIWYGSWGCHSSDKPSFIKRMSDAINEHKTVYKQWGSYKVLHVGDGFTVKELTILPGKSLSDQRHFKRDEHWLVVKGTLGLYFQHSAEGMPLERDQIDANDSTYIPKECWHRPYNEGTEPVVVVETWLGDSSEDDIERRNV